MKIIPDRDKWRNYYLDDDVFHILHNSDRLIIRKGFRFDAHSVPWVMRWLFHTYNEEDIIAALVHDYLIATMPWHRFDRKFIDTEYNILMQKHSSGLRKFIMPKVVYTMGYIKTLGWRDYRGDYNKHKIEVDVQVEVL